MSDREEDFEDDEDGLIVPHHTVVRVMEDPEAMTEICARHGHGWPPRLHHVNGGTYVVSRIDHEHVIRIFDQSLADKGYYGGTIALPVECVEIVNRKEVVFDADMFAVEEELTELPDEGCNETVIPFALNGASFMTKMDEAPKERPQPLHVLGDSPDVSKFTAPSPDVSLAGDVSESIVSESLAGSVRPFLVNEADKITVTFDPGAGGFKASGGMITHVTDGGQADQQGVKVGWRMIAVEDQVCLSFRDKSYLAVRNKGTPYQVTFVKKVGDMSEIVSVSDSLPSGAMPQVTVTFQPGQVGFKASGGMITHVTEGGQAEHEGVKVGWRLLAVGSQGCRSFADTAFADASRSGSPYQVTFAKIDGPTHGRMNYTGPSKPVMESVSESLPVSVEPVERVSISKVETITVTFQPGPVGFKGSSNIVKHVAKGGQAERLGVKIGWRLTAVGKQACQNFKDQAFSDARNSGTSYQVTFAKSDDQREMNYASSGSVPSGYVSSSLPIAVEQNPESEKATVTFQPGAVGFKASGGMITQVAPGGQADRGDIKVGWRLIAVNGQDCLSFGDKVFSDARYSGTSYQLTFAKTDGLTQGRISITSTSKPGMQSVGFSDSLAESEGPKVGKVTVTFQHGPVGFTASGGTITHVAEGGQAERLGVKVRWQLVAVEDQNCRSFKDKLFVDARNSGSSFQLSFEKKEAPTKQRFDIRAKTMFEPVREED